MTKSWYFIPILVALLLAFTISLSASAGKPNGPAAYNGLNKGKSAVSHLEMYEKDANWDAVADGAFGRLTFSDSFVFNGHGLEAGTDYTLVSHDGTWPNAVCLGNGTSNGGGNLNLSGEMAADGPKVWLVLSADVDCSANAMTGWNPAEYLFEYNLI